VSIKMVSPWADSAHDVSDLPVRSKCDSRSPEARFENNDTRLSVVHADKKVLEGLEDIPSTT